MYSQLIMSIVDNMNLSNREQLVQALQQANQPNPQAQQMAMAAQQAQIEFQKSQTAALQGQAQESQARAQKYLTDAQAVPQELEIDRIKAVTANLQKGDADDKELSLIQSDAADDLPCGDLGGCRILNKKKNKNT